MILRWIIELILIIIQMGTIAMQDIIQTENFAIFISDFFTLLAEYYQIGVNALYFMLGDSMYVFLDFAIVYAGARYLVFPVVVMIRRTLIKGGDF